MISHKLQMEKVLIRFLLLISNHYTHVRKQFLFEFWFSKTDYTMMKTFKYIHFNIRKINLYY